jgi:spore germination protein GerM
MTTRRTGIIVASVVAIVGLISLLFVGLPRWFARRSAPTVSTVSVPAAPAVQGRKIKAQLFYVADDGTRLTSVERDVPYAEQAIDQAREILNAQLAEVAAPLVSAVPPGTVVRALFLTENGQAFVDLSRDVATAHPGGSLNELLTIYTIVHALTFNLPAITAVQLLVDGKEVDTLAGHVDLRRPLTKNLQFSAEN